MGWIIANPGRTFINEDGEEMINACDHVFDCIEMGQGYHFHKGEVLWDAFVGYISRNHALKGDFHEQILRGH